MAYIQLNDPAYFNAIALVMGLTSYEQPSSAIASLHITPMVSPQPFNDWPDQSGMEINLMIERGENLMSAEIKSGQIITRNFFKSLIRGVALVGEATQSIGLMGKLLRFCID